MKHFPKWLIAGFIGALYGLFVWLMYRNFFSSDPNGDLSAILLLDFPAIPFLLIITWLGEQVAFLVGNPIYRCVSLMFANFLLGVFIYGMIKRTLNPSWAR
jgi:hypothetical protein